MEHAHEDRSRETQGPQFVTWGEVLLQVARLDAAAPAKNKTWLERFGTTVGRLLRFRKSTPRAAEASTS